MDNEPSRLDALIDELLPEGVEAPSEEPASSEDPSPSVEPVDLQPEPAVAEIAPPSDPAPTDPQPDYATQLDAMQAQLAAVQEKAQQFDRLKQMAEEQAAQRAEQEKVDAWRKRMDELEELTPAQRDAEKQRIISEVQTYKHQQYAAQVAERDQAAEDAAKAFAAWYTVAQNALPPDQFKALETDAKHLLQFASPDAMQSQVARDRALEARGYERAKAEFAKAQEAALAQQAQDRIASGADLVGAGAGAPPSGGMSIDDWVDSVIR